MRTELGESPVAFKIDEMGDGKVQITFFENAVKIEPQQTEEQSRWAVDEYRLVVANRKGLQDSIEANYTAWIEKAKDQEILDTKKILEEKQVTYSDQLDMMEMMAELQFDICLLEMGVTEDDL